MSKKDDIKDKIIFPTSSAKDFSKKLSQISQIKLGEIFIKKFPCQEKYIRLIDEVKERTLYICALFSKNVDEILMEIFLITNAAKLAQAKKINLVLPYLFYSRQDKKTEKNFREPISAKLLADLFKKAGIKKIITVHLHSQRIFKFYQGIELLNIETHQIFAKKLKKIIKNFSNFCIVAPDKGALNDCKKLSLFLDKVLQKFASMVQQPRLLNKGRYYELIRFMPKSAVDKEVIEKLDLLVKLI